MKTLFYLLLLAGGVSLFACASPEASSSDAASYQVASPETVSLALTGMT